MDLLYKEEAYKIIGACLEVHRQLGCGFLEPVYQEALEKEFVNQNISCLREMELPIYYKNEKLNKYYQADFVCYDKIIVELKSVPYINKNMEAQLLNYLHVSKLHVGYVINFKNSIIEFKRLVL